MNEKILNGSVIGLGKMGLLHSAIVNALPGSNLKAVCEPNKTIRSGLETFVPDVAVYKNHKKMLDKESLDFVFITTPPSLHIDLAVDCINRGCHVFIEKPLCLKAQDAAPLQRVIAESGAVTMVGHMMRYLETFSRAKELLDDKVLGELISFNATMYVSQLFTKGKGWRYSPKESGGGVLITQAIHVVDMLCWFFGLPRALNARTNSYYSKIVEDFGHVTFDWANGLTGWLDSTWSMDNHRLLDTTFTIMGEYGTLIVTDDVVKIYLRTESAGFPQGWTVETKPELFRGAAIDIGGTHFTAQDEAFVRSVQNRTPVESDVENAVRVHKVLDCIYKSAGSDGQTVLVD